MARKHRKAAGILASIEIERFKSIASAALDLGDSALHLSRRASSSTTSSNNDFVEGYGRNRPDLLWRNL